MKQDFKKDIKKKREDSPLRWESTVHCCTTHEDRIHWLRFENEYMLGDILTAKLFLDIATLKYKAKRKVFTNLQEYKAIKEAEKLWLFCLNEKKRISDIDTNEWREQQKLRLVEADEDN